jgi:hypothetical protein
LQIRKVQFLQILYVAQSQPQDSLKRPNQLNLALNLASGSYSWACKNQYSQRSRLQRCFRPDEPNGEPMLKG